MAATGAPARAREERGPDALLPAGVARLVGFAALACLGVSQWQRMVADISFARPLLWVAIAVGVAALVMACDQLAGRRRSAAMFGVALLGCLGAYLAAGLDLSLLKPRRLDELGSGLYSGAQALSTVRLPYDGADPWPGRVLQLLGAALVLVSGLLAFWPRGPGQGRGYPFLALAALLVLPAAPVVSLGGTRPLLLGAGITLLTVCFLWLERLPLRPGLGVAALVGLALAGALPLAAAADRGEPWFDYQAFAEGLGPKDPVRFSWEHGDYGPISWTRSGAEVVRVRAARPQYWKARTLDDFDGRGWDSGGFGREPDDVFLDLPPRWETQSAFEDTIQVSVQRMRGNDVLGAGTTISVTDATRTITRASAPGQWVSSSELRTGDSYRARVFVPRPTPDQLAAVPPSPTTEQRQDLDIRVHLRDLTREELQSISPDLPVTGFDGRPAGSATIDFPPFGLEGVEPEAFFRTLGETGPGEEALRLSDMARTWELSKQLRAGATTPYEYVQAVNSYLHQGFSYTERPPEPARGVPPLESFLFDTKAGYCQHFSAAMALLLRMGGVPARVATGFSPGGFSKRKRAWIVRDTDAHSWVEVWFDSYGWVVVDPTPGATPARSQIATLSTPGGGQSADDQAITNQGGTGGTSSTDRRAAGERESLFERLRGEGGTGTATEADGEGGGGGVPLWLVVPFLVVGVGGTAAWYVRARRRRPDDPLDRALYELETALRRSGRAPSGGMTLRQLEARLGLSDEGAGYLRAVSDGRYAVRPAMPTNAQRRALRRELAAGGGYAGRLRTFWALPPRPRG